MKLMDELNVLLADLEKFRALIKQVHWYMRGHRFLYIHNMLDEYTKEFTNYIDDIGEVIIMFGGSPISTLKEFDELAEFSMKSGSYELSIDDSLSLLVDNLMIIYKKMLKIIDLADEEDNQIINDNLSSKCSNVLKQIWMLKAEMNMPVKCDKCKQ